MRGHFVFVAAMVGLTLSGQSLTVQSAEIKVLSTGVITPVANELFPQFERETGQKISVRYEAGPVLFREIEADAAFDLAILSVDVEPLISSGKIAAGTRFVLGRTGIGIAVPKGAPKPDVSTTAAFKRTMLKTKSVAYTGTGASGVYFESLLDRLGIAAEMKGRLKAGDVQLLTTGEAEIAVMGTYLFAGVPGVEVVGMLPPELQNYVLFTGGVSAKAKEPKAASDLIAFLMAPRRIEVFRAKGMDAAP